MDESHGTAAEILAHRLQELWRRSGAAAVQRYRPLWRVLHDVGYAGQQVSLELQGTERRVSQDGLAAKSQGNGDGQSAAILGGHRAVVGEGSAAVAAHDNGPAGRVRIDRSLVDQAAAV